MAFELDRIEDKIEFFEADRLEALEKKSMIKSKPIKPCCSGWRLFHTKCSLTRTADPIIPPSSILRHKNKRHRRPLIFYRSRSIHTSLWVSSLFRPPMSNKHGRSYRHFSRKPSRSPHRSLPHAPKTRPSYCLPVCLLHTTMPSAFPSSQGKWMRRNRHVRLFVRFRPVSSWNR